ncbi:HTH-type transcriptional regulator XynR [Oligella sp. MSHR50489EDL]|uniref:IclR family transcriptional regulator n=1 Tax=Oligella sp. MSHR50489EDL TaxID=3139409 RepID=UPI003D8161A9
MKHPTNRDTLNSSDPTIQSSLRSLIVLEILSNASLPLSQTELVHLSRIPRSSLIRYLEVLEENGFIIRLPQENKYILAPRVMRLAAAALQSNEFTRKARWILQRLAQSVGESCNLTIRHSDSVHYLVREEFNEPWSLSLHIKADVPVPLHCSASGKLYLSYMPFNEQNACLQRLDLRPYTKNTIVDLPTLKKELEKIKRQGFSVDNSELVNGMIAVAVPIFDKHHDNLLLATVACHAVAIRTDLSKLLTYKDRMRQAAEDISILFSSSQNASSGINLEG